MADPNDSSLLSESMAHFENVPSIRFLQEKIDRLPISADGKALLLDLAALTLTVGGKVLAFGRKILAFVFEMANKFQNVMLGILVALILSAVLATIPVLGPAVSALLTPLMIAFGVLRGSYEDFRNMSVQREIDALKQRMAVLAAHV